MEHDSRKHCARASRAFGAWLAALTLIVCAPAAAQNYPNKPIRMIVGFSAGGPADVMARALAQRLSTQLNTPMIVDNRVGADSLLASQAVMLAEPDGYTLYFPSSAHVVNPSLYKNAGFDAVKDFTAISLVSDIPNFVAISLALPPRTLAEFISYARARKGELNYATTASITYLATEMMVRAAGIELQRISYKSYPAATTALMTNEVQLMVSGVSGMLAFVKSGKVRPLAITSLKRSPPAPEVPTAIEAGLPGYTSSVWYALLGPAKMSHELVERLNAETRKALADPETRAVFMRLGIEPQATSAAEFEDFMRSEVQKWKKIVVETGAQAN